MASSSPWHRQRAITRQRPSDSNRQQDLSSSANAPFRQALEAHLQQLSPVERDRFHYAEDTTLEDILNEAKAYDKKQAQSSRVRRCARRVTPLLKTFNQYSGMVGSLIQFAPSPGPTIWGAVLCVLQLAIQFDAYFEKIMEQFEEFGSVLRPITEYSRTLYQENAVVQDGLAAVFGDILRFCQIATSVFVTEDGKNKSGLRNFGHQTWKPFDVQFGELRTQLQRHLRQVEEEMKLVDRRVLHTEARSQAAFRRDTSLNLQAIRSTVTVQSRSDTAEKRLKVLKWLSTLSFRDEHQKNYALRHGASGSWLLRTKAFESWLGSATSALLWCCGKPGSGKTVLASVVLEHIKSLSTHQGRAIAYVYCDSRQDERCQARSLAASLLQQLCAAQETLPKPVEIAFEKSQKEVTPDLTWPELRGLFLDVIKLTGKKIIVFDALDECEDCEAMCSLLQDTVADPTNSVLTFVTSRAHNQIVKKALSHFDTIAVEEAAVHNDISAFVVAEVDDLLRNGKLRLGDPNLKQTIIDTLLRKAEGMFLWVRLQLKTLCAQPSDGEILKALEFLPYGLNKTYKRSFDIIGRHSPPEKELAMKVLSWALYAKRSLHVTELLEALAVRPDSRMTDPANIINDPSALVSVCAELIETDKFSSIQFVHSSVKDFLLTGSEDSQTMKDFRVLCVTAPRQIAEACLTYLLYDTVRDVRTETEAESVSFTCSHPFILYACQFWADHVRGPLELVLEELLLEIVQHSKLARTSLHMKEESLELDFLSILSQKAQNIGPLHLVVRADLRYIIGKLPDLESQLEKKDGAGYTPLIIASRLHYNPIANVLITQGADMNSPTPIGSTPLHIAIIRENRALVTCLLEAGADLRSVPKNVSSVYYFEGMLGHISCLRRLLEIENDPTFLAYACGEAIDGAITGRNEPVIIEISKLGSEIFNAELSGFAHLDLAIRLNRVGMLQCLMKAGARPATSYDKKDSNLLLTAVASDNVDIVNLLLGAGVDPRHQDKSGLSALELAIQLGEVNLVDAFLQAGAGIAINMSELEDQEKSPLTLAAMCGRVEIIEFLLHHGADIHRESSSPKAPSPLFIACREGHEEVVKQLLAAGASVDARNEGFHTPLFPAAFNGDRAIVQALLTARADVSARDKLGNTALHVALRKGTEEQENIVQLLLKAGIDVNAVNSDGESCLHLAAIHDRDATMKVLLCPGAQTNIRNNDGMTPMCLAVLKENQPVLRVLLENGVDQNTASATGLTPLMLAVITGRADIVSTLLCHAAACNIQDEEGMTALHFAVFRGRCDLIKALISHRANVNVLSRPRNKTFSFPGEDCVEAWDISRPSVLQSAIVNGHLAAARIILDAGGDPKAMDHYNYTCADWVDVLGQVELFDRISRPSLQEKAFRLKAATISLLKEAIEELSHGKEDAGEVIIKLDHLGRALIFSHEPANDVHAAICFEQNCLAVDLPDSDNAVEEGEMTEAQPLHPATCNACASQIYGVRFVCRVCPSCDLCFACHTRYTAGELHLRVCKGHDFLQVPRDEWRHLPPSAMLPDEPTLLQWLEQRLAERETVLPIGRRRDDAQECQSEGVEDHGELPAGNEAGVASQGIAG